MLIQVESSNGLPLSEGFYILAPLLLNSSSINDCCLSLCEVGKFRPQDFLFTFYEPNEHYQVDSEDPQPLLFSV